MATGSLKREGMSRDALAVVTDTLQRFELLMKLIEEATTVEAVQVHFDAIGLIAKAGAEDVSRYK